MKTNIACILLFTLPFLTHTQTQLNQNDTRKKPTFGFGVSYGKSAYKDENTSLNLHYKRIYSTFNLNVEGQLKGYDNDSKALSGNKKLFDKYEIVDFSNPNQVIVADIYKFATVVNLKIGAEKEFTKQSTKYYPVVGADLILNYTQSVFSKSLDSYAIDTTNNTSEQIDASLGSYWNYEYRYSLGLGVHAGFNYALTEYCMLYYKIYYSYFATVNKTKNEYTLFDYPYEPKTSDSFSHNINNHVEFMIGLHLRF